MTWLINNFKTVAIFALMALTVIYSALFDHYRANAINYKKQRDDKAKELNIASATIADMQQRQRDVAALDARYTRELADAKATIETLRDDVATGKRRLQLNATCKSNSTGASSLGNAPAATVTADAERHYWRLRAGIETVTRQVNYLQQYIKEQCLRQAH